MHTDGLPGRPPRRNGASGTHAPAANRILVAAERAGDTDGAERSLPAAMGSAPSSMVTLPRCTTPAPLGVPVMRLPAPWWPKMSWTARTSRPAPNR